MDNKEKMSPGSWLAVIGLAFSAFVFNTSEFVPIGLLSGIGASFGMSTASTGMLISVYAWVVMVMSLPLMILASRMEMRRLMLWLVGLFGLFQVMSFCSSSYGMLMASRIGVACTHSIFWSIVSPMAARIVPDRHRPVALSVVAAGSSVAMVLGMPLGRIIGLALGWRMTFLTIGIVAALVFVYMLCTMPRVPSRGRFSARKVPALFADKALLGIFVLTIFFATSYYTCYSYIEPFMKQVAGMADSLVTTTLIVFGLSGIVGSIAFSRYYQAHRYAFMTLMLCVIAACLLLVLPAACSPVSVVVLLSLWGMVGTAFNIAMQNEIISIAPHDGTAVAMSIFSGIFNFGIGTGAFVGGLVCTHLSLGGVGVAGGIIAVGGVLFWLFNLRRHMRAFYDGHKA